MCSNPFKIVKPDGKSVYGGMRDIVAEARKHDLDSVYDRLKKVQRKIKANGLLESVPK